MNRCFLRTHTLLRSILRESPNGELCRSQFFNTSSTIQADRTLDPARNDAGHQSQPKGRDAVHDSRHGPVGSNASQQRFSGIDADKLPREDQEGFQSQTSSPGDKGKRVTASGIEDVIEALHIEPERLEPNDGSLEYKEDLSPGSTQNLPKLPKKHPKSDVPREVADRLQDATVEMIKTQSGKSGGVGS